MVINTIVEVLMNSKKIKISPNTKINKLTVLSYDCEKKKYKCKCECGNITFASGAKILSGHTKSCGCYRKTYGKNNTKHGLYKNRIYFEWKNMLYRCYKDKYPYFKYYGGRGISVCKEWIDDINSFVNWAMDNGYNDRLTLDRIDVNDDYYPDNCRWVSMNTQMRNTRRNVNIIYNGDSYCLTDLCNKLNISLGAVKHLARSKNISIEDAIKLKLTKKYNKHTNRWEDK